MSVRKYVLRVLALGYLLLVLLGPLSMVFFRAFDKGAGALWTTLSDPNTVHAFKLTLIVALIAVPLNAIFGVVCALAISSMRSSTCLSPSPPSSSGCRSSCSTAAPAGSARGSRGMACRSSSPCRRW
jgi:hypothetical protein